MTLMLLDAASLYFRAFYGVKAAMPAPDGTPTNAVRGFLDMVSTLITRFHPTDMVACLDQDWRPAWRVALLPTYKTHRLADQTALPGGGGAPPGEAEPPGLAEQVPIIFDALAALGIAALGAAEHEADDVIATLAERATMPVDVVTGDRDLFQLIDDDRAVRVLYTARGVAKLEIVDAAALGARYGIAPAQYADFATLRGDPSDGLPGVPGIGRRPPPACWRGSGRWRRSWTRPRGAIPASPGWRASSKRPRTTSRERRRSSARPGRSRFPPSTPRCRTHHPTAGGSPTSRPGGGSAMCSAAP